MFPNGVVETFLGFGFFLVVPYLFFSLVASYVILRVRDARSGGAPDPDLGFKTGLHFLLSLAITLLLIGFTVLATEAIDRFVADGAANSWRPTSSSSSFATPAFKTGFALTLSGVLFTAVFGAFLHLRTNNRSEPAAARTFTGWRFINGGLTVMFALTALLVSLFMDRGHDGSRVLMGGMLIVWAPATLVEMFLLGRNRQVRAFPPYRVAAAAPAAPPASFEPPSEGPGGGPA